MLRMLRIIGIVIFASLIGLSANSLKKMQESGTLLERYNSQRKADVTMLSFSVLMVGMLGYFEVSRRRRLNARRGYGRARNQQLAGEEPLVDGLDSTSIYAAPDTIDDWQGRRTRTSRSRDKQRGDVGNVWMVFLRIIMLVLPFMYLGLLVLNLFKEYDETLVAILMPTVFGILFVLSIVAAAGIFVKRPWGMVLGYAFAVCNLLIFPYGTGVGLLLMMALVGASAVFEETAMAERRNKRRKSSSGQAQQVI